MRGREAEQAEGNVVERRAEDVGFGRGVAAGRREKEEGGSVSELGSSCEKERGKGRGNGHAPAAEVRVGPVAEVADHLEPLGLFEWRHPRHVHADDEACGRVPFVGARRKGRGVRRGERFVSPH